MTLVRLLVTMSVRMVSIRVRFPLMQQMPPPTTGSIPNFGEVAANIGIVGGGSSGGIPEPTSGLLLLVGGAMLALRRTRA